MTNVRALVLRTAGTNCDAETVRALEAGGADVERLHLNALSSDPRRLEDFEVLSIAGGFSYGDYVAAGRIFGLELRSRLDEPLRRFIADDGIVIGICNGFQILVELGLFQPDRAPSERTIALTGNASNRFECRWVTLEAAADSACPWLESQERFPVPVAHAEGRFCVANDDVLGELEERGQIALRYVNRDGSRPVYPGNPNGSVDDIAGITDPSGRVLGLMPHPERNLSPENHPHWTRAVANGESIGGEGRSFFERLVAVAQGNAPTLAP